MENSDNKVKWFKGKYHRKTEQEIYEHESIKRHAHKLGNDLQKLQSWLRLKHPRIWREYERNEKS